MVKLKTLAEKHQIRRNYVAAAFTFMVVIPVTALIMLMFGIDPSPASAIFATASATFASIVVGNFATTPTEDTNV